MRRKKIVVLGVGNVGALIAYLITREKLCDEIVLIDMNTKKAWAEARDIYFSQKIQDKIIDVKNGGIEDCGDADIVIFCASSKYQQGMSREDLLQGTAEIVLDVIPQIMKTGFAGVFITVSNPVDVINYLIWKISGLPVERVIGTGTAVDMKRYNLCRVNLETSSIELTCIGMHGDPIFLSNYYIRDNVVEEENDIGRSFLNNGYQIREYVINEPDEIVKVKKTTMYVVSSVVVDIVDAIVNNKEAIFSLSVSSDSGISIGKLARVGTKGVISEIKLKLSRSEEERYINTIKELQKIIRNYNI